MTPQITRLQTSRPMVDTLRVMGNVARAAARTWTMREWAARLATRAGARDYLGQLRELYKGVLARWRYVQEPGEWIYGKPRSLLGYALGANYNKSKSCPNPENCDVERTTWKSKGWGDCDDVTALVAAGALAIGMPRVLFRVAEWGNGAHVSAMVMTPRGRWVSIDPVGHPDKPFGWALDPTGGRVLWFDLDARPVAGPQPGGGGISMAGATATFLSGLDGVPRRALHRRHLVLTRKGDTRGPRVLTMPGFHHRLFRRGIVYDRTPAVDQFGDAYEYMSGADCWAPVRGRGAPLGRRRRRGRRRGRFRKRIKRFFRKVAKSKVGKAFKKFRRIKARVKAWILERPLVQNAVAAVLQIWGIPRKVTKAVLKAHAKKIRRGGALALVKLALKGKWRELGRTILGDAAQFLPEKLRARLAKRFPKMASKLMSGFDGAYEEGDMDHEWEMVQGNRAYRVAPVAMMMGADNMYELGQLEVASSPEPGRYYKIQKGDNILNIAGRAFGLGTGSERLKAAKMINASAYNQRFQRPTTSDFSKKYIGDTIVSFYPEWTSDAMLQATTPPGQRPPKGGSYATIWIPPAQGVEPPPACPPGSEYSEADGRCVVFSPEPAPLPPPIEEEEEEEEEEVIVPEEEEEEEAEPPVDLEPEPEPGPLPPPVPPGPVEEEIEMEPEDVTPVQPCPEGFRHPTPNEILATGMSADSCIPVSFVLTPEEEESIPTPQPTPRPVPHECPSGYIWSELENRCKWVAPGPSPDDDLEPIPMPAPTPGPAPPPGEKKKSPLPLLLLSMLALGG